MGAEQFCEQATAKTAQQAFDDLVEQARYDYGHAGYTGTIAEKSKFKMVTGHKPAPDETPRAFAERISELECQWWDDKWGPAACLDLGPDPASPAGDHMWCFFGWASS